MNLTIVIQIQYKIIKHNNQSLLVIVHCALTIMTIVVASAFAITAIFVLFGH